MSTGFQTLNVTSSCTGLHVLLGSRGASGEPGGRPELALATLIGEHEAGGEAVTTVTLRLARSEDAFWALAALRWLAAHGRRAIVRTARVMPKALVLACRDHGATVVLEMVRRLRHGMRLEPMKELSDRLRAIESEADRLMLETYRDLYGGKYEATQMFLVRDFFEILEKAIDRCREAGVVVYQVVLKNS